LRPAALGVSKSPDLGDDVQGVRVWVIPDSTASRSTATAASRSAGGPNTCGPANCMAPYPIRVTVRSSAIVNVPPGSVLIAIRIPSLLSQVRGVNAS
jgi:hypothetical protein